MVLGAPAIVGAAFEPPVDGGGGGAGGGELEGGVPLEEVSAAGSSPAPQALSTAAATNTTDSDAYHRDAALQMLELTLATPLSIR